MRKNNRGFIQIVVVILLVLVLVAAAYYFGTRNKTNLAQVVSTSTPISSIQPSTNPSAKPTSDITANWKAFSSPSLKYSFSYPPDLTVYTDMSRVVTLTYIPVCEPVGTLTCIYIPSDKYSGTNFRGAGMGIGTVAPNAATNKVQCPPKDPSLTDTGNKTYGSYQFETFTGGSAAAGNQSNEKIYYILHNGECFQITNTIMTDSSDVNSSLGSVKSFSSTQSDNLNNLFDQILSTFKFTN